MPLDTNFLPIEQALMMSNSYSSTWSWLAFLLLFLPAVVGAQPLEDARNAVEGHVEFEPHVSMAVWNSAQRNYQHAYEAGGRAAAFVGPFQVEGYARGIFWQTDKSKVVGSPVNAENNMNNMVKYGGSARGYLGNWFAGAAIHRTEIHVIWRFKERNGYQDGFPKSNDWEVAEQKCRSGQGCPSIAYQDAFGYIAGYDGSNLTVEVKYLPHRWKELTLRPRPWRGRMVFHVPDRWPVGDWVASVHMQRDLKENWRGDIRLRRRLVDKLWATARAGRFQPDHKTAFNRLALGLVIR